MSENMHHEDACYQDIYNGLANSPTEVDAGTLELLDGVVEPDLLGLQDSLNCNGPNPTSRAFSPSPLQEEEDTLSHPNYDRAQHAPASWIDEAWWDGSREAFPGDLPRSRSAPHGPDATGSVPDVPYMPPQRGGSMASIPKDGACQQVTVGEDSPHDTRDNNASLASKDASKRKHMPASGGSAAADPPARAAATTPGCLLQTYPPQQPAQSGSGKKAAQCHGSVSKMESNDSAGAAPHMTPIRKKRKLVSTIQGLQLD